MIVLPLGTFALQACGGMYGSGSGNTPPPTTNDPAAPPTTSATAVTYTTNTVEDHEHEYDVALTAFATPADQHGNTTVDDGHSHAVAVSAADLQQAAAGQTVLVTTATSEGHTHVLTLVKVA